MRTDKEKELDDLFREGLQDPTMDANFREEDWEAMGSLLDHNKKRRGIVYWLPVVSGIAAMLLLTLAWALLKNDHSDKVQITKNPAVIKGSDRQTYDTISSRATAPKRLNAGVGPHPANAVTGTSTVSGASHQRDTITQATSTRYLADEHSIRKTRKLTKGLGVPHQDNDVNITGPVNKTSTDNGTELLATNAAKLDISGLNSNEAISDPALPVIWPPIQASYQNGKNSPAIKNNNPNRPQFAITVLASPDINGVNSFKNSEVGTNAGLMFSVGLGKRFTISTGAVYSKKPYITNFSDYHQQSAGYYSYSGSGKVTPVDVSADCRVLDVPINVDYMVYNRSNNKFSIGSGLSSYIMLRENYHYNYNTTPGPSSPTDYNITNKNQHILGVLNLDATYSRRLSSKFSLGVQPYLKVPLTNIGYGQVKLQSTGVAVGLTWNINSPPK